MKIRNVKETQGLLYDARLIFDASRLAHKVTIN